MKKRLTLLVTIFFCLTLTDFAQQSPYTRDFQIWNNVQITVPISKGKDRKNKPFDKIDLVLDGTVRLGRNGAYPVDDRFGAALDFRVNQYFKVSPGYLYQRFEEVPHQKTYESRLTIAGTFEKRFADFTFRHRSMFEYRLRNSRPNTEVYRARFQVSHPVRFHDKEIFAPFISEEPYYDFGAKLWNRNEFFAGVSKKLNKNLATDVFYVNQFGKVGLPRVVSGIGVNFKIRIDQKGFF